MTPFPLLFWNRSAWILILTIQLPETMEAHKVPINSCQNCLINQRTKTRTVDISMQCCLDMPGRKHGESKKKKNQLPLKANCTWLNPHSFPFENLKKQRHLIRLILLFFIHACKCRIKTHSNTTDSRSYIMCLPFSHYLNQNLLAFWTVSLKRSKMITYLEVIGISGILMLYW